MKPSVLFSAAMVALSLAGCINVSNWRTVEGSGQVVTENRPVSDFHQVALGGSGELTLTQGAEETLTIEADDNLLPLIKSEVSNGHLWIGTREVNLRPTKRIRYHLQVKNLDGLNLSGSLNAQAKNLKTEHLDMGISGSGNIRIDHLEAKRLSCHVSGSGNFTLAGKVDEQSIQISGSGNQQAGDLKCREAEVAIAGSGHAELWVEKQLNVSISGSGSVDYYGKPQADIHTAGSGRAHSLGEK